MTDESGLSIVALSIAYHPGMEDGVDSESKGPVPPMMAPRLRLTQDQGLSELPTRALLVARSLGLPLYALHANARDYIS